MAALLLAGGTKGFRASLPNAKIVLQQPQSAARGQATDIQIQSQEVVRTKNMVVDVMSDYTGQDPERIRQDMNRRYYMTPDEAKEYGIIDTVLDPQSPEAKLPSVAGSGIG